MYNNFPSNSIISCNIILHFFFAVIFSTTSKVSVLIFHIMYNICIAVEVVIGEGVLISEVVAGDVLVVAGGVAVVAGDIVEVVLLLQIRLILLEGLCMCLS